MSNFWDERFDSDEFIYGDRPNTFFAEQLQQIPSGRLLLPMEGEGRNAVFAAKLGWDVEAFDSSKVGIQKAKQLAGKKEVDFSYTHCIIEEFPFPKERYDVVAMVFAHLPPDIRPEVHQKIEQIIKPGGQLIVEFFHPDQLGRSSGGPKILDMLYSPELIQKDFPQIKFQHLNRVIEILKEGSHHQGEAILTRGTGVKVRN